MQEETFTSKGIVADTRAGLLDEPKWLSSLYFYDHEGSRLFDLITQTDEYYPTRTEESLLAENVDAIIEETGDGLTIAEMGSGNSRKTRVILASLMRHQEKATYLPMDVSAEFLAKSAQTLEAEFPGLHVVPIAAEYGDGLAKIGAHPATRRLVLFLGSSIGNFEPEEQLALLRKAHAALQPGDAFLLGTDLVKETETLEAAYNDAAGHTAAFNLNILAHLNRELGADVDLSGFEHKAFFNHEKSRIEMHLVSLKDQTLTFPGADLNVAIAKGETIHTENSYKFTVTGAQQLAQRAGFNLEHTWTDANGWFGLHLLRR